MPVIPSIQSLVGGHSGGQHIGVDWTNLRVFQTSLTNLSRYGLVTGAEETYTPLANMGGPGIDGGSYPLGVTTDGDIFMSGGNGSFFVDGDALTVTNSIGYPSPKVGLAGMVGVAYGTTQFAVDFSLGGFGFSYLNEISTTSYLANQGYVHDNGIGCAGVAGTGVVYYFSSVNLFGVEAGPATLSKIQFNGAGYVSTTNIGDVTMASIDAGWTGTFGVSGMCLDQTDGMILAVFYGSGNSNKAYLAKIDPSDASIVWKSLIPASDGGSAVSTGNAFKYSNIQHQRLALYTGTPPTVTIYDTSDGSVDSTYSSGLAGLSTIDGQCYNDTLGSIVLGCDFSNTTGSPTRLNSTPTSWGDGYAVLYVAAGTNPTPGNGGRRWLDCGRPVTGQF